MFWTTKNSLFSWLAAAICIIASPLAQSQEAGFRHGVYGTLGYLGIDEDKARIEGIGDSAINLEGGYYGEYQGLFTLKAGLYLPIIDDEDSFSQRVEDATGDQDTRSSSIKAYGVVAEGGVRYPLNETFTLGGAIGLRTLSADRDIALCSDCRSEDLDIEGGLYIRPYVSFKAGVVDIQISYEEYVTGDFTGSLLGSVIFKF